MNKTIKKSDLEKSILKSMSNLGFFLQINDNPDSKESEPRSIKIEDIVVEQSSEGEITRFKVRPAQSVKTLYVFSSYIGPKRNIGQNVGLSIGMGERMTTIGTFRIPDVNKGTYFHIYYRR